MAEREVLTYCRICAAACGLVVTVEGPAEGTNERPAEGETADRPEGERVVRVRGDKGHPISRGYACPKGLAAGRFHHATDRLDDPMVKGVVTTWPNALGDLGARLRDIINEHGRDSVAVYLATGLAYDINGWLTGEGLIRALGTQQRYTPVTIDNAPALIAAELVTGYATLNPVWDPDQTDVLLLIGTNPVVSHGYGTALADPITRIREFQQGGGTVIVVDPRHTETAQLADAHFATVPGSDHLLLAWLVKQALDQPQRVPLGDCDATEMLTIADLLTPLTLQHVMHHTGLDQSQLQTLTNCTGRANGIAVHCGTGVMMNTHGLLAEWLRWLLLALTHSLDSERGMPFNNLGSLPTGGQPAPPEGRIGTSPETRPELTRILGQHPCAALADEITDGKVKALIVCGGRPDIAFPDAPAMDRALSQLDVLAVLDVRAHELTERATHVLPACGQFERADVPMQGSVQFSNGLQFTPAAVAPSAQRRPAWWILASIAEQLGVDALGGLTTQHTTDTELITRLVTSADRLHSIGPRGEWTERAPGWVHESLLPEHRWRFGSTELLNRLRSAVRDPAGAAARAADAPGVDADDFAALEVIVGRRVHAVNATPYRNDELSSSDIVMSPEDALRRGLHIDDRVSLTTAHGQLIGQLRLDDRLRKGTVWIGHGSSQLRTSTLTSARDGVDVRTGMPTATGLQAKVTLAP